jgi:hypothetical protein
MATALRVLTSVASSGLVVFGIVAAAAVPLVAQETRELVTDRPDATESAVTVPKGSVQMEFGATWGLERSSDARLGLFEAPGVLTRVGWFERLEVRLAWPGWAESVLEGTGIRHRAAGLADPEIGAKWNVLRHDLADIGLIAHVTLPIGHEDVSARGPDPSLVLSVAHPLGSRASFGWNAGYEVTTVGRAAGDRRRLGRWSYSGSVAMDVAERWGTFIEAFGSVPGSEPTPAMHLLQGGVTWRPTPLIQFDVAAGGGLNAAAPDRVVTTGVSFRWLK